MRCTTCNTPLSGDTAYEFRGVIFCAHHFDEGTASVERQRSEKRAQADAELAFTNGLYFGADTPIGKANRELFADRIEQYRKATKDRTW